MVNSIKFFLKASSLFFRGNIAICTYDDCDFVDLSTEKWGEFWLPDPETLSDTATHELSTDNFVKGFFVDGGQIISTLLRSFIYTSWNLSVKCNLFYRSDFKCLMLGASIFSIEILTISTTSSSSSYNFLNSFISYSEWACSIYSASLDFS